MNVNIGVIHPRRQPSNMKRAGKGLLRVMKRLERLKSRVARPRRISRLASRAQRLLDDFKRREAILIKERIRLRAEMMSLNTAEDAAIIAGDEPGPRGNE